MMAFPHRVPPSTIRGAPMPVAGLPPPPSILPIRNGGGGGGGGGGRNSSSNSSNHGHHQGGGGGGGHHRFSHHQPPHHHSHHGHHGGHLNPMMGGPMAFNRQGSWTYESDSGGGGELPSQVVCMQFAFSGSSGSSYSYHPYPPPQPPPPPPPPPSYHLLPNPYSESSSTTDAFQQPHNQCLTYYHYLHHHPANPLRLEEEQRSNTEHNVHNVSGRYNVV